MESGAHQTSSIGSSWLDQIELARSTDYHFCEPKHSRPTLSRAGSIGSSWLAHRAGSTISGPARFLEPARAALGQPDKSSQLDHARASSKNRAGATGSGQLRPPGMVKFLNSVSEP